MAIISGTIKAEPLNKSTGKSIVINTVDPEQLDRIEDKLDRIIDLLKEKTTRHDEQIKTLFNSKGGV